MIVISVVSRLSTLIRPGMSVYAPPKRLFFKRSNQAKRSAGGAANMLLLGGRAQLCTAIARRQFAGTWARHNRCDPAEQIACPKMRAEPAIDRAGTRFGFFAKRAWPWA